MWKLIIAICLRNYIHLSIGTIIVLVKVNHLLFIWQLKDAFTLYDQRLKFN